MKRRNERVKGGEEEEKEEKEEKVSKCALVKRFCFISHSHQSIIVGKVSMIS